MTKRLGNAILFIIFIIGSIIMIKSFVRMWILENNWWYELKDFIETFVAFISDNKAFISKYKALISNCVSGSQLHIIYLLGSWMVQLLMITFWSWITWLPEDLFLSLMSLFSGLLDLCPLNLRCFKRKVLNKIKIKEKCQMK